MGQFWSQSDSLLGRQLFLFTSYTENKHTKKVQMVNSSDFDIHFIGAEIIYI